MPTGIEQEDRPGRPEHEASLPAGGVSLRHTPDLEPDDEHGDRDNRRDYSGTGGCDHATHYIDVSGHRSSPTIAKPKLVSGVQKQITLVSAALPDASVDVHGALCFVEADWPLIGGSFEVNGVHVLWPKLLVRRLTEGASFSHSVDVDGVHARLAATFPVA